MKKSMAVMAGLAVLALAPTAAAQISEYRGQLETLLQSSRQIMQQGGYQIAAGPFVGMLQVGAKERFILPVEQGVDYKIVGVCDNDCSNVDLRVFNMNGENIGEDTANDDVPLVELQPTGSGLVQLEAQMVTCSAEPCYHAIEVYWKR